MATHRAAWRLAWGSGSLLGVCLALLLWPVVAVVMVFVFGATTSCVISGCARIGVDPDLPRARRTWLFAAAVRAVGVGAGVVAAGALLSVAPLLAVCLVLLAGATSPAFVRLARAKLADREQRHASARPDQASSWSALVTSAARALTDEELCRAWCASFDVLQSAPDLAERARIVALRQAYLDELERRDPSGLSAWLSSGATATENPDAYLRGPGRGRPVDD